jgi:hypothetical protein
VNVAAELKVIRVSVDWGTLLYREPLDVAVWESVRAVEWLEAPPYRLERMGRGGDATRSFSGDGLFVRLARDVSDQQPYGVQVQVQGSLLATSMQGIEVVDAVRQSFNARLYPGRDVGPKTLPGRTDLAIDVLVRGERESAASWVDREVYAHGSMDEALARFATQVRMTDLYGRIVGDRVYGRTLYAGRDPMLRIYDASTHHRKNAPLQNQWLLGGDGDFTGKEFVLRCEWQLSREFVALSEFEMADGSRVSAGDASWSEWVRVLPIVWRALLERTRQTDRSDTRRQVSKRRSSQLWALLESTVRDWEFHHCGDWSGLIELRARRRRETYDRAWERAERSIAVLRAFHPEMTHQSIGAEVGDGLDRFDTKAPQESLERAVDRVRARLQLETHAFKGTTTRDDDG